MPEYGVESLSDCQEAGHEVGTYVVGLTMRPVATERLDLFWPKGRNNQAVIGGNVLSFYSVVGMDLRLGPKGLRHPLLAPRKLGRNSIMNHTFPTHESMIRT